MTSLTAEELDQRITQSIAHATAELRDEFRAQLHEIRRGLDSRLLLDGLRSIDAASSQAEVLKALLLSTEPYARGAAILLNTPEGLRGWGMRGLQGSRGIESVQLSVSADSAWSRSLAGEGVVRGPIGDLYAALGSSSNDEHTIVPIVLRGQVAAVLATDGEEDVPALQILTYGASQAIETLSVRNDGPAPTLRIAETGRGDTTGGGATTAYAEPSGAVGPPPAPPAESVEQESWGAEPDEGPAPAPAIGDHGVAVQPPPEMPTAAPTEAHLEPTVERRVEPAIEAPSDPAPPAPVQPPVGEGSPFQDDLQTVAVSSPMVEPPAPAAGEVAPPSGLTLGADGQIVPPDDIQGPGWAFSDTAAAQDDEAESAVQDEARRLARLLVSEIKLYNEEQVEEGRQHGNVYSRLREDIDRSQQIYEERIHPSIQGKTDFFRDELVRILAGGDPDLLGM